MVFTLSYPQPFSEFSVVCIPSQYALTIFFVISRFSPSVSTKRIQRGSVQRSICGPSAVVMPSARYSFDASSANRRTISGSKHAAKPTPSGHLLTSLPAVLNSTLPLPRAPLRGSEEMFTGMPCGMLSASFCSSLFHFAAVFASSTVIMRTWRMCSLFMNSFCWSVSVYAGTFASAYFWPLYVPPNGPNAMGGTAWCGE